MSIPTEKTMYQRAKRKGWWTWWYDKKDGETLRRKLGDTKDAARVALKALQVELTMTEAQLECEEKMRKERKLEKKRATVTVGNFYRDHYKPKFLKKGAWGNKQAKHIEWYFLPSMGKKRLVSVDSANLKEWFSEMYDPEAKEDGCTTGGKNMSRGYALHVLASVKTMLRRAADMLEWYRAPTLPKQDWRLKRVKRVPDRMERHEVSDMRDALEGLDRALFVLWVSTGLRMAEMKYLQWRDIDLENARVFVKAKPQHRLKDDEDRCIPLTREAVAELEKVSTGRKNEDYFYPSPGGTRGVAGEPWSNFSRTAKELFKRAGVRDGNAQLLRHTFASLVMSSGCGLAELKEFMGHSTIVITEKHYAKFVPSDRSGIHIVDFGLSSSCTPHVPKLVEVAG